MGDRRARGPGVRLWSPRVFKKAQKAFHIPLKKSVSARRPSFPPSKTLSAHEGREVGSNQRRHRKTVVGLRARVKGKREEERRREQDLGDGHERGTAPAPRKPTPSSRRLGVAAVVGDHSPVVFFARDGRTPSVVFFFFWFSNSPPCNRPRGQSPQGWSRC